MDCCCRNRKDCLLRPAEKVLCQLKLNWLFLFILGGLASVSYTSVLYSFHQYITNPAPEQLNNISQNDITPGLGQSEAFYSWVLLLFHVGATLGALAAAMLVRVFPYWYLLLSSLILHTVSYIMYGVATSGWVIAFSKMLSGIFIGMEKTVTFSYFGESYNDYCSALQELGREESKRTRMKDRLYALHSIGVNIGYIIGPGMSAVIAHFNVDQFRSVAWYNVVGGILLIVLQFLLFHGVSKCHTFPKVSKSFSWKVNVFKRVRQISLSAVLITVFLIIGRSILSARYCVYEALFNPILSDSFGFREKEDAYVFLVLVVVQILGAFLLIVLQHLKLNNRLTAIIGVIMSILACVILTDWQAIPHDECTQYSLFHHPNIANNLTQGPIKQNTSSFPCQGIDPIQKEVSSQIEMYAYMTMSDITSLPRDTLEYPISCQRVEECTTCHGYPQNLTLCLHFTANSSELCLADDDVPYTDSSSLVAYQCGMGNYVYAFCVDNAYNIQRKTTAKQIEALRKLVEGLITEVHSQSLLVFDKYTYECAREKCISQTKHLCHWVPDSLVTKTHCHDCQPICRSTERILSFAQFSVGGILLMLSIPIGRESLTAVISDNTSRKFQGLSMGTAVALAGLWRGISLLWLEGAYEAIGKRTFLPMILMTGTLLLVLVGLLVLYPQLGNRNKNKNGDTSSKEDSVSEETKLVSENQDSD